MTRRLTLLLAILAMLAGACADTKSPRLESWQHGEWTPLSIDAYRITGKRDGAQTDAAAIFTLQDERELRLELTVVYNPTPSLGSGRWQLGDEAGIVVAESIKFLGGQGQGPSLGGRFRLDEEDGHPRFRVTLPVDLLE
jgi:hypothetical protein